jgi:hypothetical protein
MMNGEFVLFEKALSSGDCGITIWFANKIIEKGLKWWMVNRVLFEKTFLSGDYGNLEWFVHEISASKFV